MALLVAVALAGTTLVAGCRGDDADVPAAAAAGDVEQQPTTEESLAAGGRLPDVARALQRTLDQRAAAITGGDLAAFTDTLAPDPAFRAAQQTYLDNLAQLPVQVLSYAVDPATLVRERTPGGGRAAYDVVVRVSLQLEGYDAQPVTSLDRYRFVARPQGRRFRLASVTDAGWEQRNAVTSQPWDDGPVVVRTAPGVLGVFDPTSVADADPLMASASAQLAAVAGLVPYDWARTTVLYALSDPGYVEGLPDLPGGDPTDVDAVAVPVLASPPVTADGAAALAAAAPDPAAVAGVRVVLHPRLLGRNGPGRDRLLRHELTHAAVGVHDDHAPVWLREGLAEWVSVQPEAPEQRRVQPRAVSAARAGFTDLPTDAGFDGADAEEHYGLAWWAVELVAATTGPAGPWALLDQLQAAGQLGPAGVPDAATQDRVLRETVGVNTRTLARRAGKLLLAAVEPPAPTAPAVPAPTGAPAEVPAPAAPVDPAVTPATS